MSRWVDNQIQDVQDVVVSPVPILVFWSLGITSLSKMSLYSHLCYSLLKVAVHLNIHTDVRATVFIYLVFEAYLLSPNHRLSTLGFRRL